jgi:cytoskeletal protein CcmA (bactofilin family)
MAVPRKQDSFRNWFQCWHISGVPARQRMQGEIVAEEIYVRCRVIGPIRDNHVQLRAGAHVEGDVINQSIAIENGAYCCGSIRRSERTS